MSIEETLPGTQNWEVMVLDGSGRDERFIKYTRLPGGLFLLTSPRNTRVAEAWNPIANLVAKALYRRRHYVDRSAMLPEQQTFADLVGQSLVYTVCSSFSEETGGEARGTPLIEV